MTHNNFLCTLVSSNEIVISSKKKVNHSTLFFVSCAVERTIGPGMSFIFDVIHVCIHRHSHKRSDWLIAGYLPALCLVSNRSVTYLNHLFSSLWINQCIALITAAELFAALYAIFSLTCGIGLFIGWMGSFYPNQKRAMKFRPMSFLVELLSIIALWFQFSHI